MRLRRFYVIINFKSAIIKYKEFALQIIKVCNYEKQTKSKEYSYGRNIRSNYDCLFWCIMAS